MYVYTYIQCTLTIKHIIVIIKHDIVINTLGGTTCLVRLVEFAASFTAFEESMCSTSSVRRVVIPGYGQFSKCHVCFCGLDPGNLKLETVRTNKQHICF